MKEFMFIFVGGGMGSLVRYGISLASVRFTETAPKFPISTFLVNILGCFLIGTLMGYLYKNPSQSINLILIVGFCGGFTTFSTFSWEVMNLLKSGIYSTAFLYAGLSFAATLLLTVLGFFIGK